MCIRIILKLSLVSLILLPSLQGCLRYTPSREELVEENDPVATSLLGQDAILEAEKKRLVRLRTLAGKRRAKVGELAGESYHLGAGDVLEVSVFDLPELSSTARVRPDGLITLPLLGDIAVEGKTESEVQRTIAKGLRKFVISPRVKVHIQEYEARKVAVVGAVDKPGTYPLKQDQSTLLDMLSEAGGRDQNAGSRVILIPAKDASSISARPEDLLNIGQASLGYEFYFDDLTGEKGDEPIRIPLIDGDTIVVPEAGQVQVAGDVKTPGSYSLTPKMSVLGAIAAAGGLKYSAKASAVEVIRDVTPEKKAVMVLDLEKMALQDSWNFRLREGDLVRVPSSPGRFAGQQTVDFINGLLNVGVVGAP